jgi:S-adenosylmethionine hydrolase
MKGVILNINPQAVMVDISHTIGFADIRQAAFNLASAYKYFPQDTIFVTVVDPGVGGKRKAIGLKIGERIFLAPDNGTLTLVLNENPDCEIRELTNEKWMLKPVSRTFHGRDIFAPFSAYLSQGLNFNQVGDIVDSPVRFDIANPVFTEGRFIAQILYIDIFGNIITNITPEIMAKYVNKPEKFLIAGTYPVILRDTFSEIAPGELGLIVGSTGYYEIVMNLSYAAEKLKTTVGDILTLEIAGDTL